MKWDVWGNKIKMKNKIKKKKGLTLHHIFYKNRDGRDLIVELPSRGSHLILTSFVSMSANKQNIKWLKNFQKALSPIIKNKIKDYQFSLNK